MMKLVGTHYAYARRRQQITINAADYGEVHAFRITVVRGGVAGVGFRIGSSAGAQDVEPERSLGTGEHVISFVPVADVHIEFNHVGYDPAYVSSCEIIGAGDLTLLNGFQVGELNDLRIDQSGDVIYIGAGAANKQQRKLIRWGDYSWSLELYEPIDGPFRGINVGTTTLTPSATTGEITLTASKDLFKSGHIGALFRLDSVAQDVTDVLAGANQFGDSVRVTGVGAQRNVTINISGTWTATITLQRSIGEEGLWEDVTTYTANQTNLVYNDTLDNEIAFYRLGIKTGEYTSGSATVRLTFASGSNTGVVKITALSTAQSASAVVLETLGSANATENWYEGRWSDYRGWPGVPRFDDGRLWWFGKDRSNGSVSDDFESFDDSVIGDSGPIDRSIGSGPVETIFWALSLQRLTLGAGAAVFTARSSSLDEPLTASAFSLKPSSSQGSANIPAVRIDEGCVMVQRSRTRVFSLEPDESFFRHIAEDLTILAPELCEAGIIAIGVQFQPETTVHCVLADGSVAAIVYDRLEKVKAWWTVTMGDDEESIVDVVVLPGDGREDHVYYVVASGTTYCLTKWALTSECQGESMNKQADLFVSSTTAGTTLSVPTFLNGRTMYLWGDGAYRGTAVVSAGVITFPASYTNRSAGLYYRARYKSAKLAYAAGMGTALLQPKNVGPLGLLLYNTHRNGLKYGRDFDHLQALPEVVGGKVVPADYIWNSYDEKSFSMPGSWDTDARLCLQAEAQRPATVVAAVVAVETHDKS